MAPEKRAIIEELGADAVLLPGLVSAALVANDQVKYLFALLLAARDHADAPRPAPDALRSERERVGIDDPTLDEVVPGAVRCAPDRYSVPAAGALVARVAACLDAMLRPLRVGCRDDAPSFAARLDALRAVLPREPDPTITRPQLDAILSGDRDAGDSLHLLVIDLHKALNRVQAALAEEVVDGASAYGLTDVDRALVAAFMRGVNRTAPLKFDHPGLATTAMGCGERLVIQNDIGQTDAHVLVMSVEDGDVTITCSDVHLSRLAFFQEMLASWGVEWPDTVSRRSGERFESDVYHLAVGEFRCDDVARTARFLEHLGSRLVFLIDWNRARKRLRAFVRTADAVDLLRWAAENDLGHMAFLMIVDERVIHEALDLVGCVPLHYGEPLRLMLGAEPTTEFFRWALRITSEGLRAGTSRSALRDEIKVELADAFRSAGEDLVTVCREHAGIAVEVAALVRECLRLEDAALREEVAARAKAAERRADDAVIRVRAASRRLERARFYAALTGAADDVVDALEDACFLASLAPPGGLSPVVRDRLDALAALAERQVQAWVRALDAMRATQRGLALEQVMALLEVVDGIVDLERAADDAERATQREVLGLAADHRETYVALAAARALEAATDAAASAAFLVRADALEGPRA